MRCFVPFAVDSPKTRLGSFLSPAERQSFATAMLLDVLDTLVSAGLDPTVLSTAPITDDRIPSRATITVDDRELTTAVNAQLAEHTPTLIIMADLPLVQPRDIPRLVDNEAEITIAPGLGGGTNALVVREPAFRVDYHGASYLDHRQAAVELDATVQTVDSRRLATDIDESADLAEVLIHGTGTAHDWLVESGFELDTTGGRVGVHRS
ncbi:2-phospho-L-lactate guanylyltransferase [Halohasta litchfieldiae]|jgi:2-phospho-L-lactate guanylyltransferase|uniref:2-phospho-L-lactate guanylyltransferase n=1 Tax=Halohasta litchfieldiae TaxID=1073996 RepID=A0A1H6RIR9_9EURY|nr:2-phospho-L-lactate guanylyltransferase [Halohasta litchfieldiae]ATW89757.1 2-phospho-L-lactate guanylyltransferase [Halohasta litchfieldiae]SEI53214.1 phospholactate guanylyltransferase [Halohasta litchfieldiae]